MSLNQFLLILHILAVAYGMGIGLSNFLNMRIAKTQTGDIAKGHEHDVRICHRLAGQDLGEEGSEAFSRDVIGVLSHAARDIQGHNDWG
jgi:hypothetical protein